MSAPKAGKYVLAASSYRRIEDGVRRRYKRGDTVILNAEEAERLVVPSPESPAAFVKPSSVHAEHAQENPGDEPTPPPVPPELRVDQSTQFVADANGTVIDPAAGAELVPSGAGDLVVGETLVEGQAIPLTGDNGDGRPANAALVEDWRAFAISTGKVTEAEAADMTKKQLQEATAR